jgi:hypothetical protein
MTAPGAGNVAPSKLLPFGGGSGFPDRAKSLAQLFPRVNAIAVGADVEHCATQCKLLQFMITARKDNRLHFKDSFHIGLRGSHNGSR